MLPRTAVWIASAIWSCSSRWRASCWCRTLSGTKWSWKGRGQPGAAVVAQASWIQRRPVANRPLRRALRQHLGAGEVEAIACAPKMRAELLLTCERVGRQVTHGQGMRTVGPLDVLLGHDPNGRALAGHAPRRPRLSPGSRGHRLGPSRRRRSLAAQPGPQGGVAMLGARAGATTHGASALQ